jgi:hypothetical protein
MIREYVVEEAETEVDVIVDSGFGEAGIIMDVGATFGEDGLSVGFDNDIDVESNGSGTSMVTGGELTSIIEYLIAVAAVGVGVRVMTTVFVVSGPSIVFVVRTWSVTGGRVLVSMTVFVPGA